MTRQKIIPSKQIQNDLLRDLVALPILPSTLQHMGVGYLHGTSSGSLIDLLQTGLIATGQQKQVSFTGEMMGGILSLNHAAVSVIGIDQVGLAASYADKNLIGWEPSRSQLLMDLGENWMREGGASEEIISEWKPVRQKIEQARLARWETLTEEEKSLIRAPFPVLCGVLSSVEASDTSTSVPGEKALGSVSFTELILFVPAGYLVSTLELKAKYNSSCKIYSFSRLRGNEVDSNQDT